MADPLRLLFVCTANIARSAFAEVLARSMLGREPVHVSSAGTHARPGARMDAAMAAQLAARALDGAAFRSRRLTPGMLERADLVLTMEAAHRAFVLDLAPRSAGRVHTLGQFAAALDRLPAGADGLALIPHVARARRAVRPDDEVTDPAGQGVEAARRTAVRLEGSLERILPRLVSATDRAR